MKKLTVFFLALALAVGVFSHSVRAAEELEILSQTAVLIDADTGQILYEKNAGRRMYPASMTKIMTALLVVEQCSPYEVVTVSETALDIDEPDSSNINLKVGEELTVEQALYGLMLPSGNDVANALAEHVAGSQEAFAQLMTQRAQEIGALDTRFTNAHGLHEDSHYTTAYDMSLITAYAAQNEAFRDYFSAPAYEMPPTNLSDSRTFTNSQSMLDPESSYFNPDVVGGKTGFTYEAMYTLSSYASRGGRNLVSVVMYGEYRADTFDDTRALLNYGFAWFYPIQVEAGRFSGFQMAIQDSDPESGETLVVGSVSFSAAGNFTALLFNDFEPEQVELFFDMPAAFTRSRGDYTCTVEFRVPSAITGLPTLLGVVELEADVFLPNPRPAPEGFSLTRMLELMKQDLLLVVLVAGALLALVLLCMVGVRQHRLKKRRRERQRRLREQQRRFPSQNPTQYGRPGVYTYTRQLTQSTPLPRERSGAGKP